MWIGEVLADGAGFIMCRRGHVAHISWTGVERPADSKFCVQNMILHLTENNQHRRTKLCLTVVLPRMEATVDPMNEDWSHALERAVITSVDVHRSAILMGLFYASSNVLQNVALRCGAGGNRPICQVWRNESGYEPEETKLYRKNCPYDDTETFQDVWGISPAMSKNFTHPAYIIPLNKATIKYPEMENSLSDEHFFSTMKWGTRYLWDVPMWDFMSGEFEPDFMDRCGFTVVKNFRQPPTQERYWKAGIHQLCVFCGSKHGIPSKQKDNRKRERGYNDWSSSDWNNHRHSWSSNQAWEKNRSSHGQW